MQTVIDELKNIVTAKAIISATALGLFLPFAKLIYWVFDTAYLSGFGVNPDVFSRPIFSSGFISFWLFAESVKPIFIGWILFSIVVFIILFNINFGKLKKPKQVANNTRILDGDNKWIIFKKQFSYALSKSIGWPFFIFITGFCLIVFLTIAILQSSKKGQDLANEQIELYTKTGECVDKFNSGNVGCFDVSGIEGSDHFVIANLDSHILYLSRKKLNANEVGNCDNDYSTTLHIHAKNSEMKYSIKRHYVSSKVEIK